MTIPCKVCGHDMSRSRVKMATMTVRCNKCKSVYDVIIKFPKEEVKVVP